MLIDAPNGLNLRNTDDSVTPERPYGWYCPDCNHLFGDIGPIARDNRQRLHTETHRRETLVN